MTTQFVRCRPRAPCSREMLNILLPVMWRIGRGLAAVTCVAYEYVERKNGLAKVPDESRRRDVGQAPQPATRRASWEPEVFFATGSCTTAVP